MKRKSFYKSIFTAICISMITMGVVQTMVSCTPFKHVQFTPAYDQGVIDEIELGQQLSNSLYDGIMASADKSYESYDSLYVMLGAQIESIVNKETKRPKSKLLVSIANNLQTTFLKYRKQHKDGGTLNNTELDINKQYLSAHFTSLLNAEKHLND